MNCDWYHIQTSRVCDVSVLVYCFSSVSVFIFITKLFPSLYRWLSVCLSLSLSGWDEWVWTIESRTPVQKGFLLVYRPCLQARTTIFVCMSICLCMLFCLKYVCVCGCKVIQVTVGECVCVCMIFPCGGGGGGETRSLCVWRWIKLTSSPEGVGVCVSLFHNL